jgi:RNA polymerase sigma-70 factor (ECF subfamily)
VELDFAHLFDAHYDDLVKYLTKRVGRSTAEDIASETFVQAVDRRASYEPARGQPRAWLYGIALHLAARHHRGEQRRFRAYSRSGAREAVPSESIDEVIGRLDAKVEYRHLASGLAALRRPDLEVLTLSAWTDLSQAEIAVALGVSRSTVKLRLKQARSELRAYLARAPVGGGNGRD